MHACVIYTPVYIIGKKKFHIYFIYYSHSFLLLTGCKFWESGLWTYTTGILPPVCTWTRGSRRQLLYGIRWNAMEHRWSAI